MRIASRSSHRGIQERDWRAIGAGGESGSVVPDPDDPNVIYGNRPMLRQDLRTGQTRLLGPSTGRPGVWRSEWTQPMAFGPDHALYTSNQVVFRSRDRGLHWQQISGDLARKRAGVPATLDAPTARDADGAEPRGVVHALAPSPLRAKQVWAGTDDGLVHLTSDGGRTWRDVTPPALTPWSHVDAIEASRFDAATAYVAVDRHRLDDDRPYIYVTHDYGRTWRAAAHGIAQDSFVYVVREDPRVRRLLYAGTETGVSVSFDDGVSWQPLRLNMPVVSVHDLIVHDDDLAIATHGRAFWILDDVTPLRTLARDASAAARLFAPRPAIRLRPYEDEAEASPPETPIGENPPYGAPIDYVVPRDARGPVTLAIADASGAVVRAWSSAEAPDPADDPKPYPDYWKTPAPRPPATPGMHRFMWDFHAASTASGPTHRGADGPLVEPGRYTVRMTLDGRTHAQSLVVRPDPRVRATAADLAAQYALAREIDAQLARVSAAVDASKAARKKPGADTASIDRIVGAPPSADPRNSVGRAHTDFTTLRWYKRALNDLFESVESADAAPTDGERATWKTLHAQAEAAVQAWSVLRR